MIEAWFPKNYTVSDNLVLKDILFTGQMWQIFSCEDGSSVLIAKKSIADFWVKSGLINASILYSFIFGNEEYFYMLSPVGMHLEPVSFNQNFVTFEDGKSFAIALALSRKMLPEISLSDAIFFERYSRLLPERSDSVSTEKDEQLLGRWLTRGINISATSTQRVLQLLPTVTLQGLEDILKSARIPFSSEKADIKKEHSNDLKFNLPGRADLEIFFKEHIIDIVRNLDTYKNMGIDFPSAFILQGPPGCGKTYAIEKLVEYLEWPQFIIDSESIGSPYIHDTGKKISAVFEKAIKNAPSVLIIDEMEAFLSSRNNCGSETLHHVEEVAEFLRKIPEATKKHVLVVAMTNMISSIDSAILRKGRFDHVLEVGMPSREEIKAVLENGLKNIPHSDDINLSSISEQLLDHPLSDVAFVLREAARITAKKRKKSLSVVELKDAVSKINKVSKSNPIGFDLTSGGEK